MNHDKLREIIRELIEAELDEISVSGGVPGYLTPYAFKGKKGKNKALNVYRSLGYTPITENLNEASYHKFKGKISETTTNAKIRKSLREMRRCAKEMNTLIEFSSRLKEEMGGDNGEKWRNVKEQIDIISSQLNEMQKKLKTLYK
jgi:Mg2+ and Co2+ transporter CorA